jgi:hypothetical protein
MQVVRLRGLLDDMHYQVLFYVQVRRVRVEGLGLGSDASANEHEKDVNALRLMEWRVLSPMAERPSRLPYVDAGREHTMVMPPGITHMNVTVEYALRVFTQARSFPLAPLSLEHIDVCCAVQRLLPAPLTAATESTGSGASSFPTLPLSPKWTNLTTFCLPPGPGPQFGFVINHLPALEDPYRVQVWTQLNSLGLQDRAWPSHLPRMGAPGSAEQRGEERSELISILLHMRSWSMEVPNIRFAPLRPEPVLEFLAELPTAAATKDAAPTASGFIPATAMGAEQALPHVSQCLYVFSLEGGERNYSIAHAWGAGEAGVERALAAAGTYNATRAHLLLNVLSGFPDTPAAPSASRMLDPAKTQVIFITCLPALVGPAVRSGGFRLHGLPLGLYKVLVLLGRNITGTAEAQALSPAEREAHGGRALVQTFNLPGTMHEHTMAVQAAQAVRPSYEWRDLRGWHAVPAGAHTRLPISDLPVHDNSSSVDAFKDASISARRQVRVADPFQLQLRMPPPCRYFFRANVHRGTTVQSLQEQAGSLCRLRLPPGCLLLRTAQVAADADKDRDRESEVEVEVEPPLEMHHTAQQADLFNRRLQLLVDEARVDCVAARRAAQAEAQAEAQAAAQVSAEEEKTEL